MTFVGRQLHDLRKQSRLVHERSPHAFEEKRTTPPPERRKLARQRVGPLRDVAGAEADDVVAGLARGRCTMRGELLPGRRARSPGGGRARAGRAPARRGRRLRSAPRRPDRRRATITASASLKQVRERLEQRLRAACSGAAARRRSPGPCVDSRAAAQHRGDLDRMVAVVVDDGRRRSTRRCG